MAAAIKIILPLLLLTSCFSRTRMMTQDSYENVLVGEPIKNVTKDVGKPFAIHNKGKGVYEYEYIERIQRGKEILYENHYFLLVENGQVIGKYSKQERPPAFNLIYQDDPNALSY